MSYIDRRLAGPPPELALFHAARRAANLALVQWLRTDPDAADVALEIDASVAALHQLASLAGRDPL
jgi:hypothetical protein